MDVRLAQNTAQFLSMIICITVAIWYLLPRLKTRSRADALMMLVWIQVFRYVALQVYSAQKAGYPISDAGRDQLVFGDLGAAILALIALYALRHKLRIAIPFVWLLVIETLFDIVNNVRNGVHERLFEAANGVTWIVVSFYVPMVIAGTFLTIRELVLRRAEPLDTQVTRQTRSLGRSAQSASGA
ncbi:MAG TPA: hypothetical protein VFC63_13495 [Blastocatellia bacterium]|nr:hypothetical protein [Blastocatellia bacterium]